MKGLIFQRHANEKLNSTNNKNDIYNAINLH
jgi:hypothetical protein